MNRLLFNVGFVVRVGCIVLKKRTIFPRSTARLWICVFVCLLAEHSFSLHVPYVTNIPKHVTDFKSGPLLPCFYSFISLSKDCAS